MLFPNISSYKSYKIITEKVAAFSCTTNIQQLRPSNQTLDNNIYITGDYVKTNFPATLEGAVISGINCAKKIISNLN